MAGRAMTSASKYARAMGSAFGVLLMAAMWPLSAQAQDRGFPYSIMKPEPGSRDAARARRRLPAATVEERAPERATPRGRQRLMTTLRRRQQALRRLRTIPPTTIPRTQPIPPVAAPPVPGVADPAARPPEFTYTPGLRPIPNLPPAVPGRAETFQDRAIRCHHQSGLYNVPGGQTGAYIHNCINY